MLHQVMPMPSLVTPDNYVHLYDTGYAGGWGWAWFNVSETFNYDTEASFRRISEHKCRGSLRSLLSSLPQRLKYAVRKPGEPFSGGRASEDAFGQGNTPQGVVG